MRSKLKQKGIGKLLFKRVTIFQLLYKITTWKKPMSNSHKKVK